MQQGNVDENGNQFTLLLSPINFTQDSIQSSNSQIDCDPFAELQDSSISLFINNLKSLSLSSMIISQDRPNITIFAPQNGFLNAFFQSTKIDSVLFGNQSQLERLLAYHVVRKHVTLDEIFTKSWIGQPVQISPLQTFATGEENQTLWITISAQNGIAQQLMGVGSVSNILAGPFEKCGIQFYFIDDILLPQALELYEPQQTKTVEDSSDAFLGISDLLKSLTMNDEAAVVEDVDQEYSIILSDEIQQNANSIGNVDTSTSVIETSVEQLQSLLYLQQIQVNQTNNESTALNDEPSNLQYYPLVQAYEVEPVSGKYQLTFVSPQDVFQNGLQNVINENTSKLQQNITNQQQYLVVEQVYLPQASPKSTNFESMDLSQYSSLRDLYESQQIYTTRSTNQSALQLPDLQCESIMDLLTSRSELNLWSIALQISDYREILVDKKQELTMLAPVDDCLRDIVGEVSGPDDLIRVKQIADLIFGRHILQGKYTQLDLLHDFQEKQQQWISWDVEEEQKVPLEIQSQQYKGLLQLFSKDFSITVVDGDTYACNSIIHITDGLLFNTSDLILN